MLMRHWREGNGHPLHHHRLTLSQDRGRTRHAARRWYVFLNFVLRTLKRAFFELLFLSLLVDFGGLFLVLLMCSQRVATELALPA